MRSALRSTKSALPTNYSAFSDAMSIEKRYFTSDFSKPLVGLVDLLDRDHLDIGR